MEEIRNVIINVVTIIIIIIIEEMYDEAKVQGTSDPILEGNFKVSE